MTGIARAREELFAAHLLATTQFAAQAVGLAYRGALAAAEAAVEALDRISPTEPAALVSVFLRQVVRERGLDPEAGRILRSLHNRAVLATVNGAVPPGEAAEAIADATALVDGVDEWLTQSEIVTIARDFVRPQQRRRRR
ncbi:MAG: hypothetical protein QOI16_2302 [Pseudonocardiales bacterium]|jgi:hypothetical protein|nr:hypothetical protein [Pseudonocardiales bacterium]